MKKRQLDLLLFVFQSWFSLTLYKVVAVLHTSFQSWPVRLHYLVDLAIGTLRSEDGDGNGNATEAIGLISKTPFLHVHHAFLYISLPSLHDYDVKMPNFTMYRGSTQGTTKFPLSFWTRNSTLEGSPPLTKLVTWSNRDEDWKNANSLFQRRFLCRSRPRILRSLMSTWRQWRWRAEIFKPAWPMVVKQIAHQK